MSHDDATAIRSQVPHSEVLFSMGMPPKASTSRRSILETSTGIRRSELTNCSKRWTASKRKVALLGKSRGEHGKETVKLSGNSTDLAGIPVSDLPPTNENSPRKCLKIYWLPSVSKIAKSR